MSTSKNDSPELIIFPSIAKRNSQSKSWEFEVRGHIFKKKTDSSLRKLFIKSLTKTLKLDSKQIEMPIFKERVSWFLIDNKRSKIAKISFRDFKIHSQKTRANGQFSIHMNIPENLITEKDLDRKYIELEGEVLDEENIIQKTKIYLTNDIEYILISDIDDTIKISDVRNKKELLKNTFQRNFKPVPGMSSFYTDLKNKYNIVFYYVSASPWQMFTLMNRFLESNEFPEGILKLKSVRLKDREFLNLFQNPFEYKTQSIQKIIETHSDKKFILVGDSGEKDPEAYLFLLEKFPKNVHKIIIRNAYPESDSDRLRDLFKDISKDKYEIFHSISEIKDRI